MIFYFSGTGNTKWAAKHVAARLNEELKFIPDELSTDMTYTVNPGESIGFIIPVHRRYWCDTSYPNASSFIPTKYIPILYIQLATASAKLSRYSKTT